MTPFMPVLIKVWGSRCFPTQKGEPLYYLRPGKADDIVQAKKKAGFDKKQIIGASALHPEFGAAILEILPEVVEGW